MRFAQLTAQDQLQLIDETRHCLPGMDQVVLVTSCQQHPRPQNAHLSIKTATNSFHRHQCQGGTSLAPLLKMEEGNQIYCCTYSTNSTL